MERGWSYQPSKGPRPRRGATVRIGLALPPPTHDERNDDATDGRTEGARAEPRSDQPQMAGESGRARADADADGE